MNAGNPRRVAAQLDIIPFFAKPSGGPAGRISCAYCREALVLHQPDLQSPDLLVGICESCRRWFLIRVEPDSAEATLVVLPGREWFLGLGEGGGDGP